MLGKFPTLRPRAAHSLNACQTLDLRIDFPKLPSMPFADIFSGEQDSCIASYSRKRASKGLHGLINHGIIFY